MKLRPDQTRDRIPALDLISMVDLVFLLIIFFLTTSTFIEKTRANVALPREAGEAFQEIRRNSLIVNLTRNGSIVVSGDYLTLAEFLARIDAEVAAIGAPSRLDLVVRADRDASAASLNSIAAALAERNVRSWKLATAPELGKGAP